MSRKFLISLLVILTGSLGLLAQPQLPPDTLWTKTYGTSLCEGGYKVQETTDGGFIIGGYSQLGNNAPADVYAVKTDQNGNLIWSLTYGGPTEEICYDVEQTADGGYVLVGYYATPPPRWEKLLIIRVDANGDTLWSRRYGGGGSLLHEFNGKSVIVTSNGDYLIAGRFTIIPSPSTHHIFLMKVSASGDSLWCQNYDGDDGNDFKETSDGNYVIVGRKSNIGIPYSQIVLLKVDPDGNLLWSYTYGTDHSDYGEGIDLTPDGGYIITGYTTYGTDVLLIKTDQDGNLIWIKNLGAEDCSERGYDVISVSDGYIISGESNTNGPYDVYVVKADLGGNLLWEGYYGGGWGDYGYSLCQTVDGGYIIGGATASFGAGSYDFYLIKLAAEGTGEVNNLNVSPPSQYSLTVYPNPFNVSATITFSLPVSGQVKLTIYDITGQQVVNLIDDRQSAGPHSVQFDATNLSSGLYFAFLAAGEFKTTQKLLLVK